MRLIAPILFIVSTFIYTNLFVTIPGSIQYKNSKKLESGFIGNGQPYSAVLNNQASVNDLNKSDLIDFEFIGMNTGWDNYIWDCGDAIYYVTGQGIMKWNMHEGSSLFFSNKEIGGILAEGMWLYYYTRNSMEICRINLRKDTADLEVVFTADLITLPQAEKLVTGFTIYDGILYVKDTSINSLSYNLETSELAWFNDDVASGVFLDKKFYFVDHSQRTFSIYETNLETGCSRLLRGDGKPYVFEKPKDGLLYDTLIVVRDKLFYSTRVHPAIYLYNDDGEDLLIGEYDDTEPNPLYFDITTDGQYLYYSYTNTNILYQYNPILNSTLEIKAPEDFKASNIFTVVNNILYYSKGTDELHSFILP